MSYNEIYEDIRIIMIVLWKMSIQVIIFPSQLFIIQFRLIYEQTR